MENNQSQTPNQMASQNNNTTPPVLNIRPTLSGGEKKSGVGSIIATVLIIAIIVLGGLYFWGKRIETERANQALLQNSGSTTDEMAASAEAMKIETVSQDNSLSTMSAENSATQTSNLSPELQ